VREVVVPTVAILNNIPVAAAMATIPVPIPMIASAVIVLPIPLVIPPNLFSGPALGLPTLLGRSPFGAMNSLGGRPLGAEAGLRRPSLNAAGFPWRSAP
jgi:hypothetical protein